MSWDRIGGGYAWAGIEGMHGGRGACMGWDRIGGGYAWAGIE